MDTDRPAWAKEGGETIDHGDGFVSHEVDPDKLPQAIKDALAENEGVEPTRRLPGQVALPGQE